MTIAAQRAANLPSRIDRQASLSPARLDAALVSASSVSVAPALLGKLLVREDPAGRRVARIVETEAYAGPGDRASHARAGPTPRTEVMFGPAGRAYVYLVYGMHHCLNVVCGSTGEASAVLIRAAEPLEGIELMRASRDAGDVADERLAAGPGRLCKVLDIDRGLGGIDLLTDSRLWLATDPSTTADLATPEVVAGPRIGVEYAGPDWASRPWRFGIAGDRSLSRPFPTVS